MPFGLGFFAVAGAGAAGAFDLLETQVLTGSQASVTFSSLSQYSGTYKHLQIRMVGTSATEGGSIFVRFNGDTAANYAYHFLYGSGSQVLSGNGTSTNVGTLAFGIAGMSTTVPFSAVMDIQDAFLTTKNKVTRTLSGRVSSPFEVELASGVWLNTNAISSIVISPTASFATNSRFSLYGIKGS